MTATSGPTIELAGSDIGEVRHVCGLFRDRDEADVTLLPFVAACIARGERAVLIVDQRDRSDRARQLLVATVDVPGAKSSGRLVIHTWDEVAPSDVDIDPATILGFVRRALDEGRKQGFSVTRLLVDMDRGMVDGPHTPDLVAYERLLDEVLKRRSGFVLCAYDLDRHDAGTALDLLAAHRAAVVGGALRLTGGPVWTAAPPRERVLAAAGQLFGERGINATGVDTIVSTAGVAKATLYRHFSSKDALVVAWLADPRTSWLDDVRRRAETRAATPGEVLPAFFDELAVWLETGDFRGCPYLDASAEITDPVHPALAVVRDFMDGVRRFLTELLVTLGVDDATGTAERLHVLLAGSIALGVALRSTEPVAWARDAAERLVAEATAGRR